MPVATAQQGDPLALPGRPLLLHRTICARMAKLVDAPGLGPDASNGVGVRVPLLAPQNDYFLDDSHGN
jgi:hypothetical protein